MFCTKCGTQFADGQPFCPNCGTPANGNPPQGYAPQPGYGYPPRAPRAAQPMDTGKLFLFIALGALLIAIILSIFATGFHFRAESSDSFYGYYSSSNYGNSLDRIKIPFISAMLILALNIHAAAYLLMPLLGISKKQPRQSYMALVNAGLGLLTMIINWITIASLMRSVAQLVNSLGSIFGSGSESSVSFGLSIWGVFALLFQLAAVVCCVMVFLNDRNNGERKPRRAPSQYPGYPQYEEPQFQQPYQP